MQADQVFQNKDFDLKDHNIVQIKVHNKGKL